MGERESQRSSRAMQPALERCLAQAEHSRGLRGRQPLDVSQHERRTMIEGQVSDRAIDLAPHFSVLGAIVRAHRVIAHPLAAGNTRLQKPQICSYYRGWRDPDSNRGHHDFQSLRLGRLEARNPRETRTSREPVRRTEVRSLRAFAHTSGDGGDSSPFWQVRSRIQSTTSLRLVSPAATRSTRPASVSTSGRPMRGRWRRGIAR